MAWQKIPETQEKEGAAGLTPFLGKWSCGSTCPRPWAPPHLRWAVGEAAGDEPPLGNIPSRITPSRQHNICCFSPCSSNCAKKEKIKEKTTQRAWEFPFGAGGTFLGKRVNQIRCLLVREPGQTSQNKTGKLPK